VLLLDPEADEATRTKILAETRASIDARGELLRDDAWGDRALAYPIERKATAEYHLMQFHADTPELLGALERSLRIADGVLRFRITKLRAGVPAAQDAASGSTAAPRAEEEPAVEEPAPEAEVGEPA
jgi:small subunit ribosomal protein S6